MPILMRLLAITREDNKALGSSSKFTIRFQAVSCLVLSTLISLFVNEKKAIFDPETIKDMTRRNKIRMTKMVMACALITSNKGNGFSANKIFFKG